MSLINIYFESNALDYAHWCNVVPEKIQLEAEERTPRLKKNTKKTVQNHLTSDFGVDEGVYRKSFTINDYSRTKWEIAFQVFAKKPHYRLTHLLEGGNPPMYGHRTILFRWGKGRPTKITGAIGMSQVYNTELHYKDHKHIIGYTGLVRHIEPGQVYAEKYFPMIYEETLNKVLKERMKRIK